MEITVVFAAKPVRRGITSRSRSATHAAMLTIWCPTKAMGSSGTNSSNFVHHSVSSNDFIFTSQNQKTQEQDRHEDDRHFFAFAAQ